jgi:hypothetical protein
LQQCASLLKTTGNDEDMPYTLIALPFQQLIQIVSKPLLRDDTMKRCLHELKLFIMTQHYFISNSNLLRKSTMKSVKSSIVLTDDEINERRCRLFQYTNDIVNPYVRLNDHILYDLTLRLDSIILNFPEML